MVDILGRMKTYFGKDDYDMDEYDDAEYEEEYEEAVAIPQRVSNVTSLDKYSSERYYKKPSLAKITNITNKMEVSISSPSNIEEAVEVCEALKDKKITIVRLEKIDFDSAQRISDFLSGAAFALGGAIQLVNDRIFVVCPEGVDITSEIADELIASGIKFPKNIRAKAY